MKLIHGDCLDKLKELEDNSVDSIVTDPPYGLSFMGKKWDYDVPSVDIWIECLRVLKSGGHLLAFAGSRTYHRMAVRIEDAGFEIRDQIMWIYGSGFPKSMNIGLQLDKKLGMDIGNSEWEGWGTALKPAHEPIVMARKPFKGTVVDNVLEWGAGGINIDDSRIGLSGGTSRGEQGEREKDKKLGMDIGNSEWEGWGTALKPAHEPIVMARKPFKGTVVDNVLEWGAGGINIDDSRIGLSGGTSRGEQGEREKDKKQGFRKNRIINEINKGRFPANVIFDEEAGKILDEASRFFYCPKASKKDRNEGCDELEEKMRGHSVADKCGKFLVASANICKCEEPERTYISSKNHHPTVKPTDLMLYLIRLVTPKGKTTLDPFMGSGSTGKAAVRGGFDFIGIEREKEYIDIAQARTKYEQEQVKKKNIQKKLF